MSNRQQIPFDEQEWCKKCLHYWWWDGPRCLCNDEQVVVMLNLIDNDNNFIPSNDFWKICPGYKRWNHE
jgi:hypothetical protein